MDKTKYYRLKNIAHTYGLITRYEIMDSKDGHALVQAEAKCGDQTITAFGEAKSETPVMDAIMEADLILFATIGVIDEGELKIPEEHEPAAEMPEAAAETTPDMTPPERQKPSMFQGFMGRLGIRRPPEKQMEIKEETVTAEKPVQKEEKTAEPDGEEMPAVETAEEPAVSFYEPQEDLEMPPDMDNTIQSDNEIVAETEPEQVDTEEKSGEETQEDDDNFRIMIGRYKYQKNNTIKDIIESDPKFLVNIMSIESPTVEYRKYIEMIREYLAKHEISLE